MTARLTMIGKLVRTANLAAARTLTVGGSQRLRGRDMARLKAQVRKRSRGLCECSQCARLGQRLPADEFDHVVALWEGGGDGLDNLQHLNRDCHRRKTRADERRRLGLDPEAG